MDNIKTNIKALIAKSTFLLNQKDIDANKFDNYKKEVEKNMVMLLKEKLSTDIEENIKEILARKVPISPRFFLFRWIRSLINSKIAISFNAPYLSSNTISSNYKKAIFWNRLSMQGILHKIDNTF